MNCECNNEMTCCKQNSLCCIFHSNYFKFKFML